MKLPLNITIKRLVAIAKEGYYEELVELTKFDSNFRDTLLELEKQINRNRVDTYSNELLVLFEDFEIDALIRAYMLLEGAIAEFSFGNETPVPHLFDRLFELEYSNFNELADWALKNRKNEHQPLFTESTNIMKLGH